MASTAWLTPGPNAKMSEATAAMGLAGIEMMDEIIETNRKNYVAYQAGLDGLPVVRLLPNDEREARNYQYVVIEIEADRAGPHARSVTRCAVGRRHHGAALFLPRLPSHGAVSD